MPASSDLLQQQLEVSVAMLEPSVHQVQVVMAELVLDDLLRLFHTVSRELQRANLNMMGLREISSPGGLQSAVKSCFMPKRPVEILLRDAFHPFLQISVVHSVPLQ